MKEVKIKNLITVILTIDILVFIISILFASQTIPYEIEDKTTLYIISAITFGLLFPLSKLISKYKYITEHDEFGLKTDRKYYDLTTEEKRKIDLQKMADMEAIISQSAIEKMTHKGLKDSEEELNKLIGLESVKERILEIKSRMEFDKRNHNSTSINESRHMIFYGNPGTGKTTVARILTGILYKYGYIKNNKILEVNGSFLKSINASDTETKVRFICRKAYGGVLFIDEAYILSSNSDLIGKQAVATLIKEMEDNYTKFVVIMAGYTDEMIDMLDTNPGFRSRIKEYIEFPDYTIEELEDIAISVAKSKGFTISDKFLDIFDERIENEKKETSWGNARTVRNIIEEAIDKHALNIMSKKINPKYTKKLVKEDISITSKKHI